MAAGSGSLIVYGKGVRPSFLDEGLVGVDNDVHPQASWVRAAAPPICAPLQRGRADDGDRAKVLVRHAGLRCDPHRRAHLIRQPTIKVLVPTKPRPSISTSSKDSPPIDFTGNLRREITEIGTPTH